MQFNIASKSKPATTAFSRAFKIVCLPIALTAGLIAAAPAKAAEIRFARQPMNQATKAWIASTFPDVSVLYQTHVLLWTAELPTAEGPLIFNMLVSTTSCSATTKIFDRCLIAVRKPSGDQYKTVLTTMACSDIGAYDYDPASRRLKACNESFVLPN